MGVSSSLLYSKVKNLTGLKVSEFINNLRVKRAAQLLTQGKQQINEIAYHVGFSSSPYFQQVFKAHFGISPSNYRKEQGNRL